MNAAPPLAVSMGDPAGIGLEIAAKAWRGGGCPAFFVIGDPGAAGRFAPVREIGHPREAAYAFDHGVPVLAEPLASPVVPGRPDPRHAPAILAAIDRGVASALAGEASGLVTLPIAKAPLYAAGLDVPGHTERVAALCAHVPHEGPRGPVMMLSGPSLRVALVTIHLPLAAVPGALSIAGVMAKARALDHALRADFGLPNPRIALCGLNPHAGEDGALGGEERAILIPAAQALRAEGIAITDPKPADALFHPEARAGYDAALAMYHDQGLIPLKTLHFWDAVNVTLGLPIVRTSPDHGTGFDIAGTGAARPDSFIAALRLAAAIAERRRGR